ncbi:DUF3343 domain-containing protein [Candidatus Epulonipiscium viviparus]|uniref:DUF3343 domain-containing protein n=1 Tax=Candidatus Epulonipiscium viviparus TaxID=420336 RepID=UPI00016C08CE|nr:DUF3343 domain-containing protein [Candidatus Epulopiscium viviparus]
MYTIISFHTTTEALVFEQKAKDAKFAGRLIPLPRAIGAGCGICWRESANSTGAIENLIKTYDLKFDKIHQV